MHNLLFCAHTLRMNYVSNTFLLVSSSVRSKQLLCFVHGQGQKREQKPTTKRVVRFHNHSPLLTMILLNKLNHYRFRGIVNDWFLSYLNKCTQTTQVGQHISDKAIITCGVPQGSVLGPLLFLLYVTDIHKCSNKLRFYLFPDDTNIFYTDKNVKALETSINIELQKQLAYQPEICMFDKEQNKDVDLESKVYIKYLGVLIDKNLSWKDHIDAISTKTSKNVGLIAKLRHFVPRISENTIEFLQITNPSLFNIQPSGLGSGRQDVSQ